MDWDQPWIEAAIHLRENGSTLTEIAEEIGTPVATLRLYLIAKMGVKRYQSLCRPRGPKANERTLRIREAIRLNAEPFASIAKREGVSRQYVYQVRNRMRDEVDHAINALGDKDYIDDKVGILQSQEERNEIISKIEAML
tara:strand:+ start:105 stop:524 length:420 start_codon:yes stop_codon:yes gene_type:complete